MICFVNLGQTNGQQKTRIRLFSTLVRMDQVKTRPIAICRVRLAHSDRWTDGQTDKAAYRVASTQLKIHQPLFIYFDSNEKVIQEV